MRGACAGSTGGMFTVEIYVRGGDLCRRQEPAAVAWAEGAEDGKQDAGLFSPPGYRRQKPVRRPRLAAWQGVIDAILKKTSSVG